MELLVKEHSNGGHDVTAVSLEEDGVRAQGLQESGYEVRTGLSSSDISGLLQESTIDVVHIHSMQSSLDNVLPHVAEVPAVIRTTVFGRPVDDERIDCHLYPSKMALYRHLVLSGADVRNGDWYRHHQPLYNPLDVESYSSSGTSLRADLGVDEYTLLLGKLGRNDAAKWSESLVKAFESLRLRGVDCELVTVNPPGEILASFERRGVDDSVHVLRDLPLGSEPEFYNGIDIYVHSSAIGETFGYVLAEAMAAGTPIVVESTPMRDNAQIELVEHGHNGLVATGAQGMTKAIQRLYSSKNLLEEMGERGRQRANRDFDISRIAERALKAYDWCISDKAKYGEMFKGNQEKLHKFSTQYEERLADFENGAGTKYWLEYLSWRFVSNLPLGRSRVYENIQGAFLPDSIK